MGPNAFTVSELNEHIKAILGSDPLLSRVLVRGELSNYKIYSSGHHYFSLKDEKGSLRCVMFRSDAARIRFRPENGMSVLCTGSVGVYPRDGAYQLYVSEIVPDGVGDLYAAFEQLKDRLQKEGLFELSRKKPIPAMPETIAVITSGSGAAVHDVIRVLGKRWPMARVLILPVRVQGDQAAREIAGAIAYANRWRLAELIITGRGGGSMEDLWAFNEEIVARAIYASEIPVISAVGHEPDVTISDFVADLRAATPSNAAELAVPEQSDVEQRLLSSRIRMDQTFRRRVDQLSRALDALAARPVMESPLGFVQQRRQDLDVLSDRMTAAQKELLHSRRQRYISLASSLEALSPLKVLSRGFSLITDAEGNILRRSDAVSPGDSVNVKLEHGGLLCRVEKRTEEPS